MSAEAAIYPTSNSVSNRFFQNFLTEPAKPENPEAPELAASREAAKVSQVIISKKLQNDYLSDQHRAAEFLRTLGGDASEGRF